MVIFYRFNEFMPTGISLHRYATMQSQSMEDAHRIWIPAVRRFMAEQEGKGWNQAELAEASGVRANTVGDLLGGTNSQIETFAALAAALKVPLWALFCTAEEYAVFSAHVKKTEADAEQVTRQETLRAQIDAALAPAIEAMMAKLAPQPAAPVEPATHARPVLAVQRGKPRAHRKAGR